jgi:4-amino-4-deoxy-L-arabinose transferase-like glycosyltransferase
VRRRTHLLALWLLLTTLALTLPSRKLWHHVLIVFPALSLTIAARLTPHLTTRRRLAIPLASLIALGTLAFIALGHRGRTVACTDFAPELTQLPANAVVVIGVSDQKSHWREIGVVSSEFHLRPWMVGDATGMKEGLGVEAQLALVPESWSLPAGWREVRGARGWKLLAPAP